MQTEAELVLAAQAGDQKSIDELCNRLRKFIYKQAIAFRRRFRSLSVEDFAQAGFMGVLLSLKTYDVGRNLKFITYAGRRSHMEMSQFAFREVTRLHKRIRFVDFQFLLENNTDVDVVDHRNRDFSKVVENQDLIERMQLGLECLTERQRTVLHLRMEGLLFREIGEQLGITRNTSASIHRAAMRNMRRFLDR